MLTRNLSLCLMVATLSLNWTAIALAQQAKVIVIAPSDCKPTDSSINAKAATMSIHVNAQNILIELKDQAYSLLFTDESLITISHKAKSYSVQNYDELQATNKRNADNGDKYHERTGKWLGYNREFRITDETATISGLNVHKVIEVIGDKVKAEMWVSSESVPVRLRERMKSIYPEDYWKKVTFKPMITDIIMLWGVPIKMIGTGEYGNLRGRQVVCESRVFEDSISDKAFQVPPDYRKVEKVN